MAENTDILGRAEHDLAADMKQRGIGALIWDNSEAGFHYLPEIEIPSEKEDEEPKTVAVTGIYLYDGELYLIEEGKSGVSVDQYYDKNTEVKPVVVTLTPESAAEHLGDPRVRPGFTQDADLEEWLAIADCYFEALAE